MRLDFYAPRLLGARGKNFFFKNFSKIFSNKFFFKKKIKKFFSKQFFFSKKHFFLQKKLFLPKKFFFFQMTVFFQIKTFSNTLIKSFTLIKMLMFSKLFISCLSRRIVRIESAGKGMAIGKIRAVIGWKGLLRERHLCRTFKLNKNSFCQQV